MPANGKFLGKRHIAFFNFDKFELDTSKITKSFWIQDIDINTGNDGVQLNFDEFPTENEEEKIPKEDVVGFFLQKIINHKNQKFKLGIVAYYSGTETKFKTKFPNSIKISTKEKYYGITKGSIELINQITQNKFFEEDEVFGFRDNEGNEGNGDNDTVFGFGD